MIGLLALAMFVLVGSAVGIRLVHTAALRGGGSPAWACGLGFLFICLVGYPLSAVSGVGLRACGDVDLALGAAGLVFTAAGLASFYVFTLVVFRPRARWAWAFALAAIAGLGASAFGQVGAIAAAPPAMPSGEASQLWTRVTAALSLTCYAWSGFESLLEWSKARRRVALGLADPVVANRILLWGVHGVAVTALNVFLIGLNVATGEHMSEHVGPQVVMAVFGLVSSATITLAFFPTEAWKARVRARVARPA